MKNERLTLDEFRRFVDAVRIGGLRNDARCDAFTLMEGADEYDILDKYDSMSQTMQKKLRKAAREAARGYKRGESDSVENSYEDLYD